MLQAHELSSSFTEEEAIAQNIHARTEKRLDVDIVRNLYVAYVREGMLRQLSHLLVDIPLQYRSPIIRTLQSHVTKEKPIYVVSLAPEGKYTRDQVNTLAAATDLLWSLSLMYDDMFDNDLQRAGNAAAWTEVGQETVKQAVNEGLKAIAQGLAEAFGPEVPAQLQKHVAVGFQSLDEHKGMTLEGTSVDQILTNYQHRADFHTTFPIEVLYPGLDSDRARTALHAIQGVNLAGQILNDVKDLSPEYGWIREGHSDIRSGLVTYPIHLIWLGLGPTEQADFKELFGKGSFNETQRKRVGELVATSQALPLIQAITAHMYDESRASMQQVADPKLRALLDSWIDYKHDQLANIVV